MELEKVQRKVKWMTPEEQQRGQVLMLLKLTSILMLVEQEQED